MTGSITVGIDESPRSGTALRWAVDEAKRRSLPLRLLFAWTFYPPVSVAAGMGWSTSNEDSEAGARAVLDAALAHAREGLAGAGLEVSGELVLDQPGPALTHASESAAMLVVGTRGTGGVAGQLLGSVSLYAAGHAHCPVIVVPDPHARTTADQAEHAEQEAVARPAAGIGAHVLLGVDVHHPVDQAIEFAFAEAASRGVPLRALLAWTYPVIEQPRFANPLAFSVEVADADARHALATALGPWRDKNPDVQVVAETTHDAPGHALVRASAGADLIVVGARRRVPRLPGLALGTVNHAVLHHARCPIAVVPSA